jgi:iron complex outermembrane receptor protein
MKSLQRSLALTLASILSILVAQIAQAQTFSELEEARSHSQSPATTVKEWLAQIEETENESPVQVTNIQILTTDQGLEIILETQDELLTVDPETFRIEGDTLIADIPNAVLALPETSEFVANNPTEQIASVRVTQLDTSTIQVSVLGDGALPTEAVTLRTGDVVYSLNEAQNEEDEEIVITVTGEQLQQGYFVPDAVTGTRTETPLRDIPQSIQVVPQQVLREQQVTQLDEALRNVSSVTSNTLFGNFTNFTIRGFSNAPVLRNGFRQYGNLRSVPETAGLEQIEVLKGPASILFGDLQPGGAINVVSKQPLAEPFYEAEIQVGSRDFFRPRIDITGPLTTEGNLRYRFNALVQNDSGFRGFDQNYERFFLAPVLAWEIDDRTDITFDLGFTYDKQPLDFGLVAFGDGVVDVPRDRITNEPADESDKTFLNAGYLLEHRFNENWRLVNAFRYFDQSYFASFYFPTIFDEETGDLLRSFQTRDLDFQTYSLQTNIVGEFTTGAIGHTLLFGVDLSRQTENFFGQFTPPISPLNIFDPVYGATPRPDIAELPTLIDNFTAQNRLGVYLQDQIDLFDNLKLLAGIRYDTVEQRREQNPSFTNEEGSEVTQSDDAFTPRIGLVYQPIPAISLYGSYSRSFNPNAVTTVTGDFLEPERGEGWEVGVKAELNPGLFATLAYYDIRKQNVATSDPVNPDFSLATGEQRSQGVELDLTGELLPGWNLIAAYAYTDARVTQDTDIPTGNRLVNVPRHSASLWTTYTVQTGDLQGLGFGVGLNYVGNRVGDLENTYNLGDYLLTNAAIFYQRDRYRVALNFRNIFDVNHFVASNAGGRTSGIQVGAPFTVIGSLSVEF